jgi:hypothetical protein
MNKLTDKLHTYTAAVSIMSITVRAKNTQEAEGLYQKWQESEKCPECKTYDCEHYEILEDVFHTWERYSDEQLGDDPVTVTFNSLKTAQNEAHRDGALLVINALRDRMPNLAVDLKDLEDLATFEPYSLAPIHPGQLTSNE